MVMTVLLTNNARSTLLNGINALQTEIRLRAGGGNTFPTITATGQWFPITIEDSVGAIEIMRVIAQSGDVFTVKRAQEGTTAKSFSANDVVELRLTVGAMQELVNDTHTNFGRIYMTPADGVDSKIGVPAGYYFNVRSPSDDSYVDEYQNVNGVAVATGKSYPSGALTQAMSEQIDKIGSLDYLSEQLDQIAVDKGWDASFVVDGDENQHDINNKTVRFINSISDLKNHAPYSVGQIVTLKSYIADRNVGGGELICIQSNVLQDNGVTVFKSNVIGFEDHFWVRINSPVITVEMAGALPDKDFNSRDAFNRCTLIGGEFKLQEGAEYWADHWNDGTTGAVIAYYDKPIKFYSGPKRAKLFVTHDNTSSNYAIGIDSSVSRCPSFVLENIYIVGHKTEGFADKPKRTRTVEVRGCDYYRITNCVLSTFGLFNLYITRQIGRDWYTTDPNTLEAVQTLNSWNSKNGIVEDNLFKHCGNVATAAFGATGLHFRRNKMENAGSIYPYLFFSDDASTQTPLGVYSVNDDIHVYDNNSPDAFIMLHACASGTVQNNRVRRVEYRSYDLDQQKDNFNSVAHPYNPEDSLTKPFMWMDYFKRDISIFNNTVESIGIRGARVSIFENKIYSTAPNQRLISFARNATTWGTGVTYYDDTSVGGVADRAYSVDNEFFLGHSGCTLHGYDPSFPIGNFSAVDSKVHLIEDVSFTHLQGLNARIRRDSYQIVSSNRLVEYKSHPIDITQAQLTQGLGSNHMRTFVNIRGGQGAQALMRFSNPTSVVTARIFIVASNGNCLDKKLTINADGSRTVTNLDDSTTWNTGVFGIVTNADGTRTLTANVAVDACFDIQANGVWGDCVFTLPDDRDTTTG